MRVIFYKNIDFMMLINYIPRETVI